MTARLVLACLLVATALVRGPGWLWAQPEPSDIRPWEEGVSEEARAKARDLFAAGLELLEKDNPVAAQVLLQGSLEQWDHPRTRYLAALIHLDLGEPADAYEDFLAAVHYGPAPFEKPEVYQEALARIAVLEEIVTSLEVFGEETDVVVTVDGKALVFEGGRARIWIRVGEHQVVVTRGDKVMSRYFEALARTANQLTLPRLPVDMMKVRVRPLGAYWKPWALVGLGAGVALVGAPLEWRAAVNLDEFDDRVEACHAQEGGCMPTEERALLPLYERGRLQNRLAILAFVTGGVTMAAGLALVILNRPQEREVPRLSLTPSLGPDHAMLVGRVRF